MTHKPKVDMCFRCLGHFPGTGLGTPKTMFSWYETRFETGLENFLYCTHVLSALCSFPILSTRIRLKKFTVKSSEPTHTMKTKVVIIVSLLPFTLAVEEVQPEMLRRQLQSCNSNSDCRDDWRKPICADDRSCVNDYRCHECDGDDDCDSDEYCVCSGRYAGTCKKFGCASNSDCRDDWRKPICADDRSCVNDHKCHECDGDDDCDSDEYCVCSGRYAGTCKKFGCTSNNDCRDDWRKPICADDRSCVNDHKCHECDGDDDCDSDEYCVCSGRDAGKCRKL